MLEGAPRPAKCAEPEAFGFSNGELVSILNSQNAKLSEEMLEQVDDHNIPEDFRAGVVVDARVLRRLKLDKYGQQSWLLSALHVYCGREQLKGSKVVVKTPAIKNGGVMLQEGCYYRLHVMDVGKFFLNKPSGFFFWRGTVIKLGSAKKT